MLDQLPLSAHGKVDRRALPAPFAGKEATAGADSVPRDRVELELARLFEELLGVRRVGLGESFFSLGGHSLLAVRLFAEIERRLGSRLPGSRLFETPTVEGLAAAVRAGASRVEEPLCVALRAEGSGRPIFWLPPAGGQAFRYYPLAQSLEPPAWGFQAPGLDGGRPPLGSIEELAELFLAELRAREPHGPYRLAGWSFGGAVAYEMASRLEQQGEAVELLVLIDTVIPRLQEEAPRSPGTADLLAAFARELGLPAFDPSALSSEEPVATLIERLRPRAVAAGWLPESLDAGRLQTLFEVFALHVQALLAYLPPAYAGPLRLVRAAESAARFAGAQLEDADFGRS
ncbi:MAG TPA: thioesterase domain-containing protein, partial [Thermoanaerobaculia bacterium]|nr:thioesterase domain-containing protein [Thermoanaerobaculia bacterium]